MNYVFDSSVIFTVVRLGKYGELVGSYSITLTRYELGNVVFEEGVIRK